MHAPQTAAHDHLPPVRHLRLQRHQRRHVRPRLRCVRPYVSTTDTQPRYPTIPLHPTFQPSLTPIPLNTQTTGKSLTDECIREAVAFRQSLMRAYREITKDTSAHPLPHVGSTGSLPALVPTPAPIPTGGDGDDTGGGGLGGSGSGGNNSNNHRATRSHGPPPLPPGSAAAAAASAASGGVGGASGGKKAGGKGKESGLTKARPCVWGGCKRPCVVRVTLFPQNNNNRFYPITPQQNTQPFLPPKKTGLLVLPPLERLRGDRPGNRPKDRIRPRQARSAGHGPALLDPGPRGQVARWVFVLLG